MFIIVILSAVVITFCAGMIEGALCEKRDERKQKERDERMLKDVGLYNYKHLRPELKAMTTLKLSRYEMDSIIQYLESVVSKHVEGDVDESIRVRTRKQMRDVCIKNQDDYDKEIPEVVEHFCKKYNITK